MSDPFRPGEARGPCLSRRDLGALVLGLTAGAALRPAEGADAVHRHGLAMHGEPALPAGFAHLPYAAPDAPKGGRVVHGGHGAFDSLNTMAIRGTAPQVLVPYVVQPLVFRSLDEPFTVYGLLAESIATPDDRSFVEFRLRPEARFSDGAPVTADDLIFTFSLLSTRGRPNHRSYGQKVARLEKRDERTLRYVFKDGKDRELPLVLGFLPVLARHATDPDKFDSMGFTPFLGSGPYAVAGVEPGVSITLKRRPDFWGLDLPVMRGLYNFDEIRFEFFRDSNNFFEAFKTGLYDVRTETDPTRWVKGYDFPALAEGRVVKESFAFENPKGMSGFILNTRRATFADVRIREALGYLLDFEWINRNLLNSLYKRTNSFFADSELSAAGRPADDFERVLLAPFAEAIRPDVLAGTYAPPVSDGSGRDRGMLKRAVELFAEAGYRVSDGRMRRVADLAPFSFEILVTTQEKQRLALAFADTMRLIGIDPSIRYVDSSQYWRRLLAFEFDVIVETYNTSASPGNEQANRFGSVAAERQGTLNWAGVRSPAVDAMIEALLSARRREDFVAAVRALDRVLMSGHYVVPLYHAPQRWVARWARIGRPQRMPRFDFTMDTFWDTAGARP